MEDGFFLTREEAEAVIECIKITMTSRNADIYQMKKEVADEKTYTPQHRERVQKILAKRQEMEVLLLGILRRTELGG